MVHYGREECIDLMLLIDEILPIGGVEWDMVQRRHVEKYSLKGCSVDSIRRKYQCLY